MNTSTQQKAYPRYTSLFSKVCGGPIFLALAILTSLYCVFAIVDLFGALGNIFGMILPVLNAIFSVFATVGVWMIYTGAKKNNIAPSNFGFLAMLPKYTRVIKTITAIFTILAVVLMVVFAYVAGDLLADIFNGIDEALAEVSSGEGMLSMIGLDKEAIEPIQEAVHEISLLLTEGKVVATVIAIFVVLFLIFELIRFAKITSFLKTAKNTYKTGNMSAPPSMFFCVLTFIFAAATLVLNLGIIDFDMGVKVGIIGMILGSGFSWSGIIYALMIALGGVLILMNRAELENIYTQWQVAQGMIQPEAVAEAAPAAAPAEEAPAAEETPAE